VRIDYLHLFYRTLRLGPGGRVMLFRADGMLINTYPLAESALGRSFANDPLFTSALAIAGSGVQHRDAFIESGQRLIAYERVRDFPVVIAISSTERHLLSEWRDGAIRLAVAAGAALLLVGFATALALRQKREGGALRGELLITGERLHGVIQSAMDAVITVDEDENVVLFNAAAERIFGCPAALAVGGPVERFIPERFRAAHHGHIRRFGQTGTTTRRMGGSLGLFGLRANGEEFPIDASISQVTVEGHKLYTVILRDVTESRQAEAELQRSYHERRSATERLHGIVQSAMDAIITTDREQRIVVFNEAAETIFRCPAEQAIGGPLERFIPERFRAAHRAHVERFGETRVTTRMMGAKLALYGLRADGEEFPIDASISQVTVDGEKFYTVILRDITARKAAEEALNRSYGELREMSAVMHEVREAERTRIARELHDELAQWLTAIRMDVSWLSSRLAREQEPLRQRADRMKQLVDTTVAAVRRIAADLRPVMLDDLGLMPAIEHLVLDFSERSNLTVKLELGTDDVDFHEPLATAVYRMVQEALTNVARHAEATEVQVAVKLDGEALRVRVSDNGRGLPQQPGERKSYGILGIRERAQTLGGRAEIYSPPAGGTTVEIVIPAARFRKAAARDAA
jgi:PAS domain S-box-containing protein